jgi:hypothetical protein
MKLPILYSGASFTQRREAREEYMRRQGGLCYYCKGSLDEPSTDSRVILPETMKKSVPARLLASQGPPASQPRHGFDHWGGACLLQCVAVGV